MAVIEKVVVDPLCFPRKLYLNGANIINPWGFETADSYSFFTLEWQGYRNRIIESNVSILPHKNERDMTVRMREGLWKLHIKEELTEDRIVREHRLLCLEDSYFMDFVTRYRFKKEFVSRVFIADRELTFRNSNVYNQFEVDNVRLGGSGFTMVVSIVEAETCGRFTPMMYARDSGDEWVVHCRMIPSDWDKEVIKLCVSWYNRAIPQPMSDLLLKISPLRKYLWYHGERRPYGRLMNRLAPNAFPVVRLCKGQELYFRTDFSVSTG